MELISTRSSTISASGRNCPPCLVRLVTWRAASMVSASRSGVPGLTKEEPGRCSPITSITIWLVLAVP
ncbi:hypothetical protein D3C81_2240990 [compost metagenome]